MFARTMKRLVLCVLALAACSRSTPHYSGFTDGGDGFVFEFDGGTTSSASSRGADASSSSAADAGPTMPSAHVRFADWVPDAPAAGFSLCLAPLGMQAWMGPYQPKGLPFPGTSAYIDVPPGTYDAQVVAASSGDCSTGVIPMFTNVPSLADGTYITLAVIGDASPVITEPSMKMAAFIDDEAGVTGQALLRLIDAAPSLSYVDVGTGSMAGNDFRLLFPSASFGAAATITAGGQKVDGNGYASLSPMSGVELSVQPLSAGGSDAATASNVSLPAGAVDTLVIVGGKRGSTPARLMMCDDAAAARGEAQPCNVFSH